MFNALLYSHKKSKKLKKAIVIGSGIGGLATAVRLANQKFSVSVFEANSEPGGKLTAFEKDGFRFDKGPSLFTMPHYVDELFESSGKNPRDYFQYHKVAESCHYWFEDGLTITAFSETEKYISELALKFGVRPQQVQAYFDHCKLLYEKSSKIFLEKSLHRAATWLSADVAEALLYLHRYKLLTTMHKANESFFDDERLVQLFDRYATYNGSNPYKAPGILTVIPWLEQGFGTWYPKSGMHSITMAIYKLALELGVQFHFNAPVEKIIVEQKIARGIESKGKQFLADCVVSNMDVVPTYRRLLKDQKAPEATLNQERSSSALIFYWGVKSLFRQLGLHNIFFSKDYKTEFKHLFELKSIYSDPTVYINITSKETPTDAPEGCENWFVMVNAPADYGQNWDEIIPEVRRNTIDKLSRLLNIKLDDLIVSETILHPKGIETATSSYRGALYGAASNNRMAAFARHPNFSAAIKGLYFCGGSVHPGGGIPLCLLSAKITANEIENQD